MLIPQEIRNGILLLNLELPPILSFITSARIQTMPESREWDFLPRLRLAMVEIRLPQQRLFPSRKRRSEQKSLTRKPGMLLFLKGLLLDAQTFAEMQTPLLLSVPRNR